MPLLDWIPNQHDPDYVAQTTFNGSKYQLCLEVVHPFSDFSGSKSIFSGRKSISGELLKDTPVGGELGNHLRYWALVTSTEIEVNEKSHQRGSDRPSREEWHQLQDWAETIILTPNERLVLALK